MTLESRPDQPQNPEGISPQLQERFEQMQTKIVERLEPQDSIIITSSDQKNPQDGYNLSINKDGI